MSLLLVFLSSSTLILAQVKEKPENDKLNQNVDVIREYDPTISDAVKIGESPRIIDTVKVIPDFEYVIKPRQLNMDFELAPIKAATMLGEPLNRLYGGYVKAGFGNYLTPFAELHYSTLRSKKYSISAGARHLSSMGKIKNDVGKKVEAGFSENEVGISGKKFLKKKTVNGNLLFNRDAIRLYGYSPVFEDTSLVEDDIFHTYTNISASVGLITNYIDSTKVNYDIALKYDFFQDHSKFLENKIDLKGRLNYFYGKEHLGLDPSLIYYKQFLLDTTDNVIFNLNPWFRMFGKSWRIKAGLVLSADISPDIVYYHWYPDARLQFNVIDEIIVPYVGLNGYLESNDYQKITRENPFMEPGYHVTNTNHKLNIYAGIRGSVSSKTTYHLNGQFSKIDSMYFYVNSLVDTLQNKFSVVYDNIEMYRCGLEIAHESSDKLNILLRGNYYYYATYDQEYAWHKPVYDITLNLRYKLQNKIILCGDFFVLGKRYVKSYYNTDGYDILDEVFDLNLSVEYRYNKNLSAFLNLNNIAALDYNRWNNYPVQRFNCLVGISYSFLGEKVGDE